MSNDVDRLTPANPDHLTEVLAFALRRSACKRAHDAEERMSAIVARRIVAHLERSGFVILQQSPALGAAHLDRGFQGR